MSRIPPKAKRVFKGEIFDVYHWRQKMFDGSVETFEMLKRPATVQVIPVKGEKIFLALQKQPTSPSWFVSFFGGRADRGEKPLAAAKRELREESGLISRDWSLWKIYEPHYRIDWKIYYYIGRDCKKVTEPYPDSGEKFKIRPVDFETFIKLITSDKFKGGEFISDLLRLRQDPQRLQAFRRKLFGK